MAKYMMLYKGPATDMSAMAPDQVQEEMGRWMAWYGGLGEAVIDMGSPFGMGGSVVDNGSEGTASDLTGYSIVEADSLDAAKAMTSGHPFIRESTGDYAIDVFEMHDMSGEG